MASTPQWIWSNLADPTPVNRYTYFMKTFTLDEYPEDAVLRIAADSNAMVMLNGTTIRRRVTRYDEANITCEVMSVRRYLLIGTNELMIMHHNWGDITTFQRSGQKHAGLWVSSSFVSSDESWKWCHVPQFVVHTEQISGIAGDAKRIRFPVIYDTRALGPLPDRDWKPVKVVTNGPWNTPEDVETGNQRDFLQRPHAVVNAGNLAVPSIPDFSPIKIAQRIRQSQCLPVADMKTKAEGLCQLQQAPWRIEAKAGRSIFVTFDLWKPVHGYPYLVVDCSSDLVEVDLGYGEVATPIYNGIPAVTEDGWVNTEAVVGQGYADQAILCPGRHRLEFPDERTARWITLHFHFKADGAVTLRDVGIDHNQYAIRPKGSFKTNSPLIEQIVSLCLTHAEITMSDVYVDTPGREDGQWIEDNRPRANLASAWFGDNALRRTMIRTLAQGQGDDGNLHPFYPSNYPAYPAGWDWSMQWTAMLYDDYMWTGDLTYTRRFWPNLVKFWKSLCKDIDKDGLWKTTLLMADIRASAEWKKPFTSSGTITPWVIQRLDYSVVLAEAMGETATAAEWRETARKLADAFRKYHIVPPHRDVPAHVADIMGPGLSIDDRGYSQASQTIAISLGLLDPTEALEDIDYAFSEPVGAPSPGVTRWNNPTYLRRALNAMVAVGRTERAVRHLVERFEPYLAGHVRNTTPAALQGAFGGPLPEYWIGRDDLGLKPGEINPHQPEDDTGSHGWNALALLWFHESLLGVTIAKPGGVELNITPRFGGFPYISGSTHSPKGMVHLFADKQEMCLEMELPVGVMGHIMLPDEFGSHAVVVEGNVQQLEGLRWLAPEGGTLSFRVL